MSSVNSLMKSPKNEVGPAAAGVVGSSLRAARMKMGPPMKYEVIEALKIWAQSCSAMSQLGEAPHYVIGSLPSLPSSRKTNIPFPF